MLRIEENMRASKTIGILRRLSWCVLAVAVANFFAVAITAQDSDPKSERRVSIRLVGNSFSVPDTTLRMSIDKNGNLFDIDSHSVKDESLRRSLHNVPKGKVCYIKLSLSDEDNTSIRTLQKALNRIREAASHQSDTIVYVYLANLE